MSSPRWLRMLGFAQLGFVVLLGAVSPPRIGQLPAGMHTPVLAFELAHDETEIAGMFGPASSTRARWLAQMRIGTYVDYGFLLIYGVFWACAARRLMSSAQRRRPLQAAFALALLAPAADAIENGCLLAILAAIDAEYATALSGLAVATSIKWLALAGCNACLSPALFRQTSLAARAAAVCGVLGVPLSLAALALRGLFAEAMFMCDALCTIGVWIWSLTDPGPHTG